MTTLYASIEAAEVRCSEPKHCKNCQREDFLRHTYGIGSVAQDAPVRALPLPASRSHVRACRVRVLCAGVAAARLEDCGGDGYE